MTDNPDDLVDVDSLDGIERAYCKRGETETGKVSRRLIDERRRAAEGRALATMRRDGESLYVRTSLDRPGEPRMMTTEVASVVDLAGESRHARRR